MKGSTILVIAILFILVCSLVWGLGPFFRRAGFSEPKTQDQKKLSTERPSSTNLTFKAKANFDGKTEDKRRFSDLIYEASDGTRLSRLIIFYETAQQAQEKMEQEIKGAYQLLERSKKLETAGTVPGDRVVISYYPDSLNKDKPRAKILWTKDAELHSIDGPSPEHVKALEVYESTP